MPGKKLPPSPSELWRAAEERWGVDLPAVVLERVPWDHRKRRPALDTLSVRPSACGAPQRNRPPCTSRAGAGTSHYGIGQCGWHYGNTRSAQVEAVLVMSHAFAQGFDVSPAEALAEELGRSVGAVRWLDSKLASAASDDDLLPNGRLGPYVAMRLRERGHLLKVASAGIAADLAGRLEAQVAAQGLVLANLLSRCLAEAEIDAEAEDRVREVLARELRAIGSR